MKVIITYLPHSDIIYRKFIYVFVVFFSLDIATYLFLLDWDTIPPHTYIGSDSQRTKLPIVRI